MTHPAKFSVNALIRQFPEPEMIPKTGACWVMVSDTKVAVTKGNTPHAVFREKPGSAGCTIARVQYLGHIGDTPYYAGEIAPGAPLSTDMGYFNVRELYGKIPDDELALAAYAVQIIDFDRTTQFCGKCGTPTRQLRTERSKLCPACNLLTYPRLSPAVIVLVRKGDEILLARSPHFPSEMYSVLAGFVEPGETLEQTVHREVKEEVGITVKNLRYFASEPWPFPNSLMIGFTAEYQDGGITIDNNEIIAAGWFDREHLPALPSTMSISWALINAWIKDAVD
jgi:NAD+ diphosphatase